MADVLCNVAKGRWIEWFWRVNNNDPTNSAIILVPISAGTATDDQIRDADTLAAILALGGGLTERTANGWNRKTITDADIADPSVDDSGNTNSVVISDQTWTPTADAVTDILVCYDSDTTAGTDSNILPIGVLDFAVTGDGSVVTMDVGSTLGTAS